MEYYKINKPTHGTQEWLAVRWRNEYGDARISASVAAAVHDEHPYTTGGDLAIELLSDMAPQPKTANQAMERGNRLEPMIRDWAAQLYSMAITEPVVMYCYDEPGVRLIATLDGITDDGTPVEIKTTTRKWEGELPRSWYWQGVQQAICARANQIEWVIFDSTMQLHRYTQKVSSDEMRLHIEKCREFLVDIDLGIIPFGTEVRAEHATYMHPKADGTSVELKSEVVELVSELANTRKQLASLEKQESELKGRIGLALGDAAVGIFDGNEVVSWKNQTRTSFDQKRFEQEHPALFNKFRKETNIRIMKTKGAK